MGDAHESKKPPTPSQPTPAAQAPPKAPDKPQAATKAENRGPKSGISFGEQSEDERKAWREQQAKAPGMG